MALLDIWNYVRTVGDRRLRQQGYVASGMGLLERYRRAGAFWDPHLQKNRQNLLDISAQLGPKQGGTLLVLGAGRLLDVPWEQLFPLFERVVLLDADSCIVSYVEGLVSASKIPGLKAPIFNIGDLTSSVVDVAAWSEPTIRAASSASAAAKQLQEGFERAGTPQPEWARTYTDVRLVVSTNLVSQLGYFPRLYVQTEFRKRFGHAFADHGAAAEALECYFDRVRARHVHDIASYRKAWAYLSSDIEAIVYQVDTKTAAGFKSAPLPPHAGVSVDARGDPQFAWPAKIIERNDPIHGQKLKELWPREASLKPPQRWAWHIVPQGTEKKYTDTGRIHIVEAWTKKA
ncbi:MAG TPA: hypothetical protein VEK08_03470 [Planctomycetota bacterium]|nr:hypothetical protein [Planctomycetota bacterium]